MDSAHGAIVVAHPYRRTYREHDDVDSTAYYAMLQKAIDNSAFPLADGIEALNGRGSPQENAFSQHLAKHLGKPATGASDAHRLEDLGTFATEFFRPIRTTEDLVDELTAGRFRPLVLDRRPTKQPAV